MSAVGRACFSVSTPPIAAEFLNSTQTRSHCFFSFVTCVDAHKVTRVIVAMNPFSPGVAMLLAVLGGFTNALKAYTGVGCELPSPFSLVLFEIEAPNSFLCAVARCICCYPSKQKCRGYRSTAAAVCVCVCVCVCMCVCMCVYVYVCECARVL